MRPRETRAATLLAGTGGVLVSFFLPAIAKLSQVGGVQRRGEIPEAQGPLADLEEAPSPWPWMGQSSPSVTIENLCSELFRRQTVGKEQFSDTGQEGPGAVAFFTSIYVGKLGFNIIIRR